MPDSRVIGVTLDPTRCGHPHRAAWLGICRYAEAHDWRLVLDPFADRVPAAAYDGVLTHGNIGAQAHAPKAPTVRLTPTLAKCRTSQVTPDYRRAGRLAARRLIECDYISFAVFGRNRDRASSLQMEGFRRTVRRKSGNLRSMIFGGHTAPTPARWPRLTAILDDWFQKAELPVGIFAVDDLFARRLADAAARAGLRIPDDVGIVGSGNDPVLCEAAAPTLTSVDLGYETVGYRAAATLDEMFSRGRRVTIHRKVAPVGIVPRRSTDRYFFDEPIVSAALGWIARHCHERIRVDQVAEGVGVTPWALRKLMRLTRRHTVVHAIARARLDRAMSLLESTDHSIEAIVDLAGYTTLHAMDRAFREHLHTSPRAFRQAAQPGGPISVQRSWPPGSPIVHAKALLRETSWAVDRVALVTGYGDEKRLLRAFRRHEGTTPGVWRSIHGRPAVRRLTAEPEPPWPEYVNVTFYDRDGNVME